MSLFLESSVISFIFAGALLQISYLFVPIYTITANGNVGSTCTLYKDQPVGFFADNTFCGKDIENETLSMLKFYALGLTVATSLTYLLVNLSLNKTLNTISLILTSAALGIHLFLLDDSKPQFGIPSEVGFGRSLIIINLFVYAVTTILYCFTPVQ